MALRNITTSPFYLQKVEYKQTSQLSLLHLIALKKPIVNRSTKNMIKSVIHLGKWRKNQLNNLYRLEKGLNFRVMYWQKLKC